jgi:hypothetical protein
VIIGEDRPRFIGQHPTVSFLVPQQSTLYPTKAIVRVTPTLWLLQGAKNILKNNAPPVGKAEEL